MPCTPPLVNHWGSIRLSPFPVRASAGGGLRYNVPMNWAQSGLDTPFTRLGPCAILRRISQGALAARCVRPSNSYLVPWDGGSADRRAPSKDLAAPRHARGA